MPGWRVGLWATLVVIALWFLYSVRGVLLPFVLAFVLAVLLEPLVKGLAKRGLPKGLAVTSVLASFFLLLTVLVLWLAPPVTRQAASLTSRIQETIAVLAAKQQNENFFVKWQPVTQLETYSSSGNLDRLLRENSGTLSRLGLPSTNREIMEQYVEPRRPQLTNAIQALVNGFFGFLTLVFSQVIYLLLVPIILAIMLGDLDGMRSGIPKMIPPSIRASTLAVMGDIGEIFQNYLRGMLTMMLLFSTCAIILFSILGVPYSILFGALVGVLYLIPVIGNITSTVTVFCLVGFNGVSGNFLFSMPSTWAYAALCTGVFFIQSVIFDNLILPRLVGNAIGLSPVLAMFVILCGGTLFGLPGMVLAFPVAGSIKVLLERALGYTTRSNSDLSLPAVPLRHKTENS